MSVRTRSSSTNYTYQVRSSIYAGWTYGSFTASSSETSEGGSWFPLNTSGDDGGPWKLTRIQDLINPRYIPNHKDVFKGYLTVSTNRPNAAPSSWPSPVAKTDSELNSLGTTAIARSAPTNPAFDMSVAVGELLGEGLPTVTGLNLMRERAQIARGAGKEYLNTQFGWLPLVNDVRSFARSVKDSHAILESYRKGSDKKIRVGYSFPSSGPEIRVYQGNDFYPLPAGWNSWGSGTLNEVRETRTWFSGAFKYHIPVPDTTLGKFNHWLSMADHLLGVKVTPETLWNLAPWSWAVDWFTNTGDILTNVANLGRDGLAMQYGYVMNHTSVRSDFSVNFLRNGITYPTSRSVVREYKQRAKATPFGFGVGMSTLSGRQIAIIAALGLSKT